VVKDTDLPIILGVDEQHPWVVNQQEVLRSHHNIANGDSNILFTSMIGLPKADVTHLTPAGLVSHGEIIYNGMICLIENSLCPTPVNENIAYLKNTSQSSTGYDGIASKVVDGNINGNWAGQSISHTLLSNSPWWRVDLANNYLIDEIRIYNRTDCCSSRLEGAKLLIANTYSTDPTQFVEIATLKSNYEQIYKNINLQGRYIMVYLPGSNKYLSLAEVQVYGHVNNNNLESVYNHLALKDRLTELKIFPNPIEDKLTIQFANSEIQDVMIFDFLGSNVTSKISTEKIDDFNLRLDMNTLPNGFYLIRTKTTTHNVYKK
jgi:Secretion system C-terminal sorting domain/F5/8 type C domain